MRRDTFTARRKARQKRYAIMVSRVVQTLPVEVRVMLERVAIVVEVEPSPDHLSDSAMTIDDDLLGLYQGIPLTDRDSAYSLVIPDRITLFVGPLERTSGSRMELEEQIRITLLHELGHHLGFDEDGLDSLGLM